jgi:hypothetical protein
MMRSVSVILDVQKRQQQVACVRLAEWVQNNGIGRLYVRAELYDTTILLMRRVAGFKMEMDDQACVGTVGSKRIHKEPMWERLGPQIQISPHS